MEGIKKESEGTDVSADVTAFLGASRAIRCETTRELSPGRQRTSFMGLLVRNGQMEVVHDSP